MAETKNKNLDVNSNPAPDTQYIATVSGVVLTVMTGVIGLIGFAGQNSYTPIILDQIFGISKYVNEEITKKVDSGYADSFVISYDEAGKWKEGRQLLFYAEKEQDVKVTIRGNASGDTTLVTQIDDSDKNLTKNKPFNLIHADVTQRLSFDSEPGANLHFIRFRPQNLKAGEYIVVESLVLVYRKTQDNQ